MISDTGIINGASAGRARAVVQAEMALIAAQYQLRTIKEKALLHGVYDPNAYDAAITTYREARAWAVTVRAAWRYWQAHHGQAEGMALR